jgi:flagellar hook assembly protein FlgD
MDMSVLGEQVRTLVDGEKPAGRFTEIWNGRNDSGFRVAAGTYVYRLVYGREVLTRKMVLLP